MSESMSETAETDRILVIDDEKNIRDLVVRALSGRNVVSASSAEEARSLVAGTSVALIDLRLGDENGLELMREFLEVEPGLEIIVMTAHSSVDSAVEAMRDGAFHYLEKPFQSLDELRFLVDRALETASLEKENSRLKGLLVEQDRFEGMIGESEPMARLYQMIEQIAPGDATVLITGESGTGKELVARAIHRRSKRARGPFVDINCAAIPHNLLESELFGYEKGAFTGANKSKQGMLETGNRGTIFLDEIAEIPLELQAKLLRVLDERRLYHLGATKSIALDIRIVCATNRELKKRVENGEFREDLYFRLAVIELHVPPLRNRKEDVVALLRGLAPELSYDPEVLERLSAYRWPGNIRELKNLLERFRGFGLKKITLHDLPEQFGTRTSDLHTKGSLPEKVDAYEKRLISEALEVSHGAKSEAARLLRISRQSLQYKLDKHDLI